MIIEGLLNLITQALGGLISQFNLPSLPDGVISHANDFLDLLFVNSSLLGLFVRITTLKSLAAIMLILMNFKHIYTFAKWAINKIPFFKK